MKLVWADGAWDDYRYWQQADPAALRRINALIVDARRQPFTGLGKPEPLKGNVEGWWSRRITAEHRLVYRPAGTAPDQALEIAQCRWHYA